MPDVDNRREESKDKRELEVVNKNHQVRDVGEEGEETMMRANSLSQGRTTTIMITREYLNTVSSMKIWMTSHAPNSLRKQRLDVRSLFPFGVEMDRDRDVTVVSSVSKNGSQCVHQVS